MSAKPKGGTCRRTGTSRGLYYHLYKAQFEHALSMPMPDAIDADLADPAANGRPSADGAERAQRERLGFAAG